MFGSRVPSSSSDVRFALECGSLNPNFQPPNVASVHAKLQNSAAMCLQEQERLNAESNAKLAQQQAEEEELLQQQVSRSDPQCVHLM